MHAVESAPDEGTHRGKVVGRKVEKTVEVIKNADSNNHGKVSLSRPLSAKC